MIIYFLTMHHFSQKLTEMHNNCIIFRLGLKIWMKLMRSDEICTLKMLITMFLGLQILIIKLREMPLVFLSV